MIGTTLKDERYSFLKSVPTNPNKFFINPEANSIKNKEKYFKIFGAVIINYIYLDSSLQMLLGMNI
jgi:hypothetical protein